MKRQHHLTDQPHVQRLQDTPQDASTPSYSLHHLGVRNGAPDALHGVVGEAIGHHFVGELSKVSKRNFGGSDRVAPAADPPPGQHTTNFCDDINRPPCSPPNRNMSPVPL